MGFEAFLSAVDWSSLSHAYGSADDVPELLRLLMGEDEGRRRDALYALYGNIYHQGSIYSATPPTAEAIVLGIEESPAGSFVEPGVELLLHLVSGYGEHRDATRQAAGKHPQVIGRLLAHDSERIRSLMPFVVAHTKIEGAGELLRKDFARMPLSVRVSRALALAHVDGDLDALAKEEKEPAVRLALALAAARIRHRRGEDPTSLADAARNASAWRALLLALPPRAETAIDLPPSLLSDLPPERACPFLIGAAEATMELEDEELAFRVVEQLISVGLRQQETFDPNALSADEKDLLRHILRCEAAFSVANTEMDLSERLGIEDMFETQTMLSSLLGVRARTSLVLVKPRDLQSASDACDQVGMPAWKDATFVFFRGSTAFLETAIPEKAEDWTEEVMAKGRAIATCLMQDWISALGVKIDSYRFYPGHDLDELEKIGRAHDADVSRPAPPDHVEPKASIEGYDWPFLDEEFSGPYAEHHFQLAVQAGDLLDARGFQESRAWKQAFESMARGGIAMHPMALGKRFGTKGQLVVGIDVFSDTARRRFEEVTGEALPEQSISILTSDAEGGSRLAIRAGITDLLPLLAALGEVADAYLASGELAPLLAVIEPYCHPLLAVLGPGKFAVLAGPEA